MTVWALLAVLPPAPGAPPPPPPLLSPGETLVWRVHWKPFRLAPRVEAAELTVRQAGSDRLHGRPVTRVEAALVSVPGFRVAIRDYFITLADPVDWRLRRVAAWRQEGEVTRQQVVRPYPAAGWLWLKEHTRPTGPGGPPPQVDRNDLHHEVPDPLVDALGMMAAVRQRLADSRPLDGLPPLVWGARITDLDIRETGRERLDTPYGRLPTRRLGVRRLFGELMDPAEAIQIWLTDDSRAWPVRVRAQVRLGHVQADLVRVGHTEEPLVPDDLPWLAPIAAAPAPPPRPDAGPRPEPPADMVTIPGGRFHFRADPDRPGVLVTVAPFRLDRHEVTNRQYAAFLAATGRPAPDVRPFAFFRDRFKWSADGYAEYLRLAEPYRWRGGRYPPGTADWPVVLVDWEDAAAYAAWAGKRLPTEAEWAWAARGARDRTGFPWGEEADPARAVTTETDPLGAWPVGSRPAGASPQGVLDLSGNVAEWVADWFSDKPPPAGAVNPTGPRRGKRKVIRGGSWRQPLVEAAADHRMADWPDNTYVSVGFRCAAGIPPGR